MSPPSPCITLFGYRTGYFLNLCHYARLTMELVCLRDLFFL